MTGGLNFFLFTLAMSSHTGCTDCDTEAAKFCISALSAFAVACQQRSGRTAFSRCANQLYLYSVFHSTRGTAMGITECVRCLRPTFLSRILDDPEWRCALLPANIPLVVHGPLQSCSLSTRLLLACEMILTLLSRGKRPLASVATICNSTSLGSMPKLEAKIPRYN